MTIRQIMHIWGLAKGDPAAAEKEIEQLSARYNVDSTKAFERWLPKQGHTLDLFDYEVSLLPQKDDKDEWVIVLTWQPGYDNVAVKYAQRLEEAGVSFIMDPLEDAVSLPTPYELFGVDVGQGWRPLVEPIVNRINELNADGYHIEITQIKEKWGELCIYVSGAPDEISDMIDQATEKSHSICERCGKPAEWIISTRHWYYTLCPDCLKERKITVKTTVEETARRAKANLK